MAARDAVPWASFHGWKWSGDPEVGRARLLGPPGLADKLSAEYCSLERKYEVLSTPEPEASERP